MKKLLPSVVLTFASLAAFAGAASAGHTFGLFTGCHGCGKCGGLITLRQYNAFSPAACGSMVFQGCTVAPPAPAGMAYDAGFPGFGGYGGDCSDGSCASGIRYGAPAYGAPVYGYPNAVAMPGPMYQYAPMMMPMPQMPAAPMPAGAFQGAQPASVQLPR